MSRSCPKSLSDQSVNIGVIKPAGTYSFWNWFIPSKNKQGMKNLLNNNIQIKLNTEELETLKRNGIDLQQLQNFASNRGKKTKKRFIILAKGKVDPNKFRHLKSDVSCNILKCKTVSKQKVNQKHCWETSSNVSIKSKKVLGSNIISINTKKSSKSIVSIVHSKAGLTVGLQSNVNKSSTGNINKNIFMKEVSQALLKEHLKKKVFIPIYLGEKNLGTRRNVMEEKSGLKDNQKGNIELNQKETDASFSNNSNTKPTFTDFSLRNISVFSNLSEVTNDKTEIKSVKDIFRNSENPLTLPNIAKLNISSGNNNVLDRNTNIGCDMMLKLLETLCKTTNKNSKPIFLAETQKQSKPHDIPIFNICDASFKMNDDQLKGLKTSMEDCRIELLNERHDQEKDCTKLKNTEVDNLSSTVTVKENRWSQKLSRNSLSSLADQSPESVKNKNNLGNYEKHSSDKENGIASPQKKFELPTSDETKIQHNSKAGNADKTNLSNQDKIPLKSMLEKSFENNLLKFHHEPSKSKILNNFVKANKNDLNLQCTEYKNVKEVKLRMTDDKTKKNFIKLPVEGNSSDICSISIEQSEHFDSTKTGEELREAEVSMDLKREPKLSITILLTNNLNGGGQIQNNETVRENVIETRNKASCHNKNSNCVMIDKNISNPNESSIEHRCLEKNISLKGNVSFENIISPSVFEAVNKPDKCYARYCGDTNDTHILKAKLLSRPLLKPIHQQQFGIEGAAYLNQEQRKMLETKIAKTMPTCETSIPSNSPVIGILPSSNVQTNLKTHNNHVKKLRNNPYCVLNSLRPRSSTFSVDHSKDYFLNSNCVKTRSNRYCMTLHQEPIMEGYAEKTKKINTVYIGDHQKNVIHTYPMKVCGANYGGLWEDFKRSSGIVNNNKVSHSEYIVSSKSEVLVKSNCTKNILKSSQRAKSWPRVNIIKIQNISIGYEKIYKDLIRNKKVDPKQKNSVVPDIALTSMNMSEMIKCCPCIIEKINATETFVQSQAEVLLEKSGYLTDTISNISIFCKNCARMSKSAFQGKINTPDFNHYSYKINDSKEATGFFNKEIISKINNQYESENKTNSFLNETDTKLLDCGKNITCRHTCLPVPSADSLFLDISDSIIPDKFVFNVTPDLDLSQKNREDKRHFQDHSKYNKTYSLKVKSNSNTNISKKEDGTFYRVLTDNGLETCCCTEKDYNYCKTYFNSSGNDNILTLKNGRCNQKENFIMNENIKPKNNCNFVVGNSEFSNCYPDVFKTCIDDAQNKQHQPFCKKKRALWVTKNANQDHELKTQNENPAMVCLENCHYGN